MSAFEVRGAVLLAGALVACGEPAPTWHQDVAPIAQAYCMDCHRSGGIAPFDLDDPEDIAEAALMVERAVGERVMPPFQAERGHTPLKYDTSLTDAQIDTFLAWIAADFPLGDPDEPGAAIALDRGGLDEWDLELAPAEPYRPTVTPDDYRCFVIDWPETSPRYVTGFDVLPGDPTVDHHVVAYAIGPDQAALVESFDEAEEGPGYTCFGSAARTGWEPDSLVDQLRQAYLGAWTPGVTGRAHDNGQRVEPGSKIVLQVHYFTLGGDGGTDLTRIRLRLADAVEREAFYMPWMSILWPAGGSMITPAGQVRTHEHEAEPVGSLNLTVFAGEEDFSEGMLLHSVFPHMHVLGRALRYTLLRADGTEQVLVSIPRYDFDWQQEYVFETPVEVLPGDRLRVECTIDNTEAWRQEQDLPAGGDVDWGEGTLDEMCVAHTRITHR